MSQIFGSYVSLELDFPVSIAACCCLSFPWFLLQIETFHFCDEFKQRIIFVTQFCGIKKIHGLSCLSSSAKKVVVHFESFDVKNVLGLI